MILDLEGAAPQRSISPRLGLMLSVASAAIAAAALLATAALPHAAAPRFVETVFMVCSPEVDSTA